MGLRVALGCSLTRSAIIAAVLAVLGGACAIFVRPERDPERLWRSAYDEFRAGRLDRAEAMMRRLVDLRHRLKTTG